ncbi:MAG: methyltransferase domain-containing protein [Dehalococcoidia bacterium]
MGTKPLGLDQTPQGWDKVVQGYEETAESLTGSFMEQLIHYSGLKEGDQALDVAAGPGILTLAVAKLGANVLGTDFSPLMVERLQARVAGLTNVQTQVMDGQDLQLPDNWCDVAFSNFGIIFFPDPDKGLQEMHRVLKPGGRVAVSTWSSPQNLEFLQVITGAIRQVVPAFLPPGPHVWLRFQDAPVLRQSLERCEFRQVQIHTIIRDWPQPSASWLPQRIQGIAPPMADLLGQFSEEQRHSILDVMTKIIQEKFDQGRSSLANEAHIGIGVK